MNRSRDVRRQIAEAEHGRYESDDAEAFFKYLVREYEMPERSISRDEVEKLVRDEYNSLSRTELMNLDVVSLDDDDIDTIVGWVLEKIRRPNSPNVPRTEDAISFENPFVELTQNQINSLATRFSIESHFSHEDPINPSWNVGQIERYILAHRDTLDDAANFIGISVLRSGQPSRLGRGYINQIAHAIFHRIRTGQNHEQI